MIRIKINEHICESEAGSTIIEVADRYGIEIPRFCYHSELSIAANCRMCLVEVSNSPRPVPACATPISDGLEVQTRSAKTQESQKSVLEFLLINHPLDCPICDQGGECDLQDLTLRYGNDRSQYQEEKRRTPNLNLGPLVATEMNRCIHCTRCVRFGAEIAGVREIGALGRGEDTRISNALQSNLRSSISANIIDLCPVGALTSKPLRYQGRTWQYKSLPTISYHDAGRARMVAHLFRGQPRRMVSQAHSGSRDYWLTDRDRFGFLGLQTDRFNTPMVWKKGSWHALSWNDFYEHLGSLQKSWKHWAGWFHPMATNQEKKALKNYISHLQGPQGVFDLQHRKKVGMSLTIESALESKNILLLGSFWESQQSIFLLHIRQWMLSVESADLAHVGFISEDLSIYGVKSTIDSPEKWLDLIKSWIGSKNEEQSCVFINAQILNNSMDYLSVIEELLLENNIPYIFLGLEAPLVLHDQPFQSRACMQPDVVVTLHLEQEDWTQDRMLRTSLDRAKECIAFTSMLPKKSAKEGQICVPIAAPSEASGQYYSLWHAEPVEALAISAAPQDVLSFSDLIEQWVQSAPIIPHLRPIPISKQSTDELAEIIDDRCHKTESLDSCVLIVLKNPLALNMVLRRSIPLQQTPIAQEQQGFWVHKNRVGQEGARITVQDNDGNTYTDRFTVIEGLPENVILYWSGLSSDEPLWGNFCKIVEEIAS